jgi:SAM-dependent methyltransferase
MSLLTLPCVEWLLSDIGQRAITEADAIDDPLRANERLRRTLGAEHAALAVEQADLRRRALAKFRNARQMLFTRRGLEQATDEGIARYKGDRIARQVAGGEVVDLCCGVGGDLAGMVAAGLRATGVDRNAALAAIASHNAALVCADAPARPLATAEDAGVERIADDGAWHADPDRRAHGARTTRPDLYDPPLETLAVWRSTRPNAVVKLAPAARLEGPWVTDCELEWISRDGECRQQVVWCGALAGSPGERRATRVEANGDARATFLASPCEPPEPIGPRTFVFEPDPAVLAAGLAGALAGMAGIAPVAAGAAYYTGDSQLMEPLLASFKVDEVLPLERKRLAAWLAERRVGRLEVKVRGGIVDPQKLRAELCPRGDDERTLLVYPDGKRRMVIVAHRVPGVRP